MAFTRHWLAALMWLCVVAAAPVAALAQDAGRGAELFELCVQCHGPDGGGDRLALAPAIAGLSEWYVRAQLEKFRGGHRGLHPDDVGGLRMYPMSRTLDDDADLQAVAAYVASLPPVYPEPELEGGDPARGQQLFTPCVACHGQNAEGLEALGGPNMKVSNDWYLLTQLQHFKAGVRGAAPGDASGARMRPMSMVLVDEQAMMDVIAYIMTLGR
jgi:cytochrome c553